METRRTQVLGSDGCSNIMRGSQTEHNLLMNVPISLSGKYIFSLQLSIGSQMNLQSEDSLRRHCNSQAKHHIVIDLFYHDRIYSTLLARRRKKLASRIVHRHDAMQMSQSQDRQFFFSPEIYKNSEKLEHTNIIIDAWMFTTEENQRENHI